MDDIRNLLEETIAVMARNGKTPEDVCWVGNDEYATSWGVFAKIADVEYDSGYGSTEVVDDLLIVGDDWWLERHEYDGSEWWEYKTMPRFPVDAKPLERVIGRYEATLEELHEENGSKRLDVER